MGLWNIRAAASDLPAPRPGSQYHTLYYYPGSYTGCLQYSIPFASYHYYSRYHALYYSPGSYICWLQCMYSMPSASYHYYSVPHIFTTLQALVLVGSRIPCPPLPITFAINAKLLCALQARVLLICSIPCSLLPIIATFCSNLFRFFTCYNSVNL